MQPGPPRHGSTAAEPEALSAFRAGHSVDSLGRTACAYIVRIGGGDLDLGPPRAAAGCSSPPRGVPLDQQEPLDIDYTRRTYDLMGFDYNPANDLLFDNRNWCPFMDARPAWLDR